MKPDAHTASERGCRCEPRPRAGGLLSTLARCFVIAISIPTLPAAAGEISAIRHWSAPDHTRIVIDVAARPRYETRTLTGPDRIAVDLAGTTPGEGVSAITIDDGLVERVRINRLRGNVAQVVIDLVAPRRHEVFTVEPAGGRPHRVVIDVFRPQAEPPATPGIRGTDDGVTVVVIDPGHGGEDPGAARDGLQEKEVVLAVARALEKALRKSDPSLQVHLTRTGDYYVPLRQRYRFAESRDADLFVSLHVNAEREGKAQGADLYFLSLGRATDTEARRVAELENAADLVGGAPPEAENDLVSILADLQMKNTLARSSLLAESVLGALERERLLQTRSVNQARFVVLQSARVPSILVEMGFISSRNDLERLRDPAFLDRFARSLKDGLLTYIGRLKGATAGASGP